MSEQEYPYEALRTFCASKPTEFDAFMRLWKEEHPDPISIAKILTDSEVNAMWTEEEKNRTVAENLTAINDAIAPVEEKPKRKRKTADVE